MNKHHQKEKKIKKNINWKKLSPEETIKYLKTLQVNVGPTNAVKIIHELR